MIDKLPPQTSAPLVSEVSEEGGEDLDSLEVPQLKERLEAKGLDTKVKSQGREGRASLAPQAGVGEGVH